MGEFKSYFQRNLKKVVQKQQTLLGALASKDEVAFSDLSSTLQGTINGKADSATTLAGYGITDAYTKTETDTRIDGAISATYKPAPSSATVGNLPALTAANEGKVSNVSTAFTTTADFVEGAGINYPAGTNVVIVDIDETGSNPTFKYDALSGVVDLSSYSTTAQMNTAIQIAVADKIELTDLSVDVATGNGNVLTAVAYDSSTGEFSQTKGVTAVLESDLIDLTNAEIDALFE